MRREAEHRDLRHPGRGGGLFSENFPLKEENQDGDGDSETHDTSGKSLD